MGGWLDGNRTPQVVMKNHPVVDHRRDCRFRSRILSICLPLHHKSPLSRSHQKLPRHRPSSKQGCCEDRHPKCLPTWCFNFEFSRQDHSWTCHCWSLYYRRSWRSIFGISCSAFSHELCKSLSGEDERRLSRIPRIGKYRDTAEK